MALRIKKSEIPDDFEALVEHHRQALLSHRFTIDTPAPVAPDLIAAAIKRVQYDIKEKKPDDFVLDYEIEDDTPPPPTLSERKNNLLHEVLMAEQAKVKALSPVPASKMRLYNLKLVDIQNAKHAALDGKAPALSAEDEKFLNTHEEYVSHLDELSRGVARVLSDVEDLTDQTIDGWQMPAWLQS